MKSALLAVLLLTPVTDFASVLLAAVSPEEAPLNYRSRLQACP